MQPYHVAMLVKVNADGEKLMEYIKMSHLKNFV